MGTMLYLRETRQSGKWEDWQHAHGYRNSRGKTIGPERQSLTKL